MNGFHRTLSHLSAGQTAETLGIGFCTFRLWDSVGRAEKSLRSERQAQRKLLNARIGQCSAVQTKTAIIRSVVNRVGVEAHGIGDIENIPREL